VINPTPLATPPGAEHMDPTTLAQAQVRSTWAGAYTSPLLSST
jgi:hypothetical protein